MKYFHIRIVKQAYSRFFFARLVVAFLGWSSFCNLHCAAVTPPNESLLITSAERNAIQQTISMDVALEQGNKAFKGDKNDLAYAWLNRALVINPRSPKALTLRGQILSDLRLNNLALKDFDQAIVFDPKNKEVFWLKASIQADRHEYDKALKTVNEAIRLDPGFAPAYETRAWARYRLGETNQAVADVSTAIKLSPDLASARRSLGTLTRLVGHPHEIVNISTNLAIANPAWAESYYLLANEHCMENGELNAALPLLTELIRLSPTNSNYLAMRGWCYARLVLLEQASEDLNAALKLDPSNPLIYKNRGYSYEKSLDNGKALADYVKAISLDPHYDAAYRSIKDFYSRKGSRDGFQREMDEAAKLNTNAAYFYFYEAGIYLRTLSKLKESVAQFSRSIQLNPGFAEAFFERGRAYSNLRDMDSAFKDFDHATRLDPTQSHFHVNRGEVLASKGKQEEAVAEYKLALRANPWNTAANADLQQIRSFAGQRELLFQDYMDLIKIHPEGEASYLLNLGDAQLVSKHYKESIANYDTYLEMQPADETALLQRARAKRYSSDLAGALKDAQLALLEAPFSGPAMVENGFSLQMLGRNEEALAMVEKAVEHNPRVVWYRGVSGTMHGEMGQMDKALKAFTAAILLDGGAVYYYQRGRILLLQGKGAEAAIDAREYLQKHGWNSGQSAYAVLQAYEGYLKAGQEDNASGILREAKAKLGSAGWFNLLIRHLRGEIREEVVMARALDQGSLFMAHYFLGLEQLHAGRKAEATLHLNWIKDNPQKEFALERQYALAELTTAANIPESKKITGSDSRPLSLKPDLNRDLAIYLPLTQDIADHSTNKLPVKINGEITIKDGAAFFKGGDNFLDLPHINLGLKPWAVSFWVRFTGTNAMYGLLEQKDSDVPNRYMHMMLRGKSQPQLGFYMNDVISPTTLEMRDSWHHFVFQFTGLHQQIWVDGVLICERVSEPYEGVTGMTRIGRSP
ncbi:MAG: lipoprotein NlpI, partial [Verrucomicrobiales bacterium]|nr:lipoprotein NlpI [Verrucomicrobiales bacterium]